MSVLKISTEKKGDRLFVRFEGPMDESADYSVIDFSAVTQATFDFENISLINSTGIQKCVAFFKDVPPTIALTFEKCASRLILQINQFPWFVTGKKINYETFYAPYFCGDCDKDFQALLTPNECILGSAPKAPSKSCPTCGAKDTEFDSLEKKYFLFLNRPEQAG